MAFNSDQVPHTSGVDSHTNPTLLTVTLHPVRQTLLSVATPCTLVALIPEYVRCKLS